MSASRDQTIIHWEQEKLSQFGRVPLRFDHSLHQHQLFSDAKLARLIESMGRGDYYVNTMDITRHDGRSRREGEIRGLSGAEVLDAVQNGRIWILLLYPHKADSGYSQLLDAIYDEVGQQIPGFVATHRKMTILISSPQIQVYYHCDIPGQTLWQVRGRKRVYVYPNREPFLNQACLEKIALGEAHEISLPYEERFDAEAVTYNLEPGQMLHWPLNAPHRIVNHDCVNVSFTTEHFTIPIRRMFYVNYANGILRHRLGWRRLEQRTSGPGYWVKLGLAAAYKLAGGQKKHRKTLKVDFAVDPKAPDGVRTIPAHEFRR